MLTYYVYIFFDDMSVKVFGPFLNQIVFFIGGF